MQHEMKLQNAPFEAIRAGTKTIEMRLYDEKRALIRTDDTIVFTNVDTGKTLRCVVLVLHRYKNFEELYNRHDKLAIGYTENEVADPRDMLEYYPSERIEKYGVLAIELKTL